MKALFLGVLFNSVSQVASTVLLMVLEYVITIVAVLDTH